MQFAKYNFNKCICEVSFKLNYVLTKVGLKGSLTIKTFYKNSLLKFSLSVEIKPNDKPKQVVVHTDFKIASMSEVWIMVKCQCGYTFWVFNPLLDAQMGFVRFKT